MCTLYSRAASCHTFNLGSKDNFKYQLEGNARSVQYLTTSLRQQLNTTQNKAAVTSQYIKVQAILQSCFWGSGYVARTLTLLFLKLCIHLIVPSHRMCTAKQRVFLQLLSVGTVSHALRLSLCVLYSSSVFGGKLRTLRNVSRILAVVYESDAVLFHNYMIPSWYRIDTTAPHTSSQP